MRAKMWVAGLVMGFVVAGAGWAAQVNVPPGVDTLNAAIAAAANGDMLILETGTYSCSDAVNNPFLVNKSLTIRANTNDAAAMISCAFTIAGAGISVVVQGLDFSTNINVDQAADVKILQNSLFNNADIEVTDYKTTEGDGSLTVVGNHLTQNGDIQQIYSNDAYIAANVLDTGQIEARVPVWIVGNTVVGYGGTHPVPPIEVLPGTGSVQIIGNHVNMAGGGGHEGIDVGASYALIAGNIIRVSHGGTIGEVHGIRSSATTYAVVINNVAYRGSIAIDGSTNSSGISSSGRITGNIIWNLNRNAFYPIIGLGSVEITNNLCYENLNNASCGSSAITTDPLLDADLKPTAGSPVIDAGPDDFAFADLDRTRNDIGAYGGPWNIEQYDLQRDPLNYAPYVFPLFKANSAFSDGSIEVRALGVARLR